MIFLIITPSPQRLFNNNTRVQTHTDFHYQCVEFANNVSTLLNANRMVLISKANNF